MGLSVRRVCEQFPEWTDGHCRAYRAGALAGMRGRSITEGFEYDSSDDSEDEDYTLSFYRGYADAVGEDVQGEDWFEEINDWRIAYRWWE